MLPLRNAPACSTLLFVLLLPVYVFAADLAGAKDPPNMKRYEGSELIGYRAPKFDEFLLPLGPPSSFSPPTYEKSAKLDGLVSRYTYLGPAGRSAAEVLRNYRTEFQRLGLETVYEKAAGDHGWFGPTLSHGEEEDKLGQILEYNEAEERVLVGKSKEAKPAYYYVFVTSYKDGVIPERLDKSVSVGRVLAQITVVAPEAMEQKMTFVNADEMSKSLAASGRIALYGVYFDTDRAELRTDSQQTLQEIAKLLQAQPQLKLHIVGHTDNQGSADHNLELSRRRAASVVNALTGKFSITGVRLDSFGAGWYSPVASNDSDEGRARNRRVELVKW